MNVRGYESDNIAMKMVKNALVSAAYHARILRLRSMLSLRSGFRILMYHHVLAEPDPFLPHITVDAFARQLDFLRREMQVFPLEELAGKLVRREKMPRRSVALTFDDEYGDIYQNAFPLLKARGVAATVFIATGFVDTDRVPWTDELGFIFGRTEKKAIQFEGAISLEGEGDRLRAFRRIKAALKAMGEADRRARFDEVRRQLAVSAPNPMRVLGRREIREMADAGISFGAHTVSHPILSRISPDEARREIRDSRRMIEEMSGRKAQGFCYPNGEEGDFSPEIEGMVKEAGFAYACSTIEGVNRPGVDVYALRRQWTSEESLPLFAARVL